MGDETVWVPSKSPEGNDQWMTGDDKWADTFRLTADLALVTDPIYKEFAKSYREDHALFDRDFANAWFKLMHRSGAHPKDGDLEADAGKCTNFDFLQKSGKEEL